MSCIIHLKSAPCKCKRFFLASSWGALVRTCFCAVCTVMYVLWLRIGDKNVALRLALNEPNNPNAFTILLVFVYGSHGYLFLYSY